MGSTTRCKFECVSITKRRGWGDHPIVHDAEFHAVTSGSEENQKFFASTPSGTLKVGTVAPDIFEVGKSYYLDIVPAEPVEA